MIPDLNAKLKFGDYRRKNKLYKRYHQMIRRCHNKNDNFYYRYGGRGISVCEEWKNNYALFYKWAYENGYKPHLTIDRIDNDGNYEPSNCRWVSNATNARRVNGGHCVISIDDASELCEAYALRVASQVEIAKYYGVDKTAISRLTRNAGINGNDIRWKKNK